jgi:hypothetical protein
LEFLVGELGKAEAKRRIIELEPGPALVLIHSSIVADSGHDPFGRLFNSRDGRPRSGLRQQDARQDQ